MVFFDPWNLFQNAMDNAAQRSGSFSMDDTYSEDVALSALLQVFRYQIMNDRWREEMQVEYTVYRQMVRIIRVRIIIV